MYSYLLVEEKHKDYYISNLLFKTSNAKDVVIGNKVIYEDKIYKIIDVHVVYKKMNEKAFYKETNIYIEYIE